MDEEAAGGDEGGSGAPAWMATFADLMSLLMCFFVLLLAFSEMDVLKFKQLAGSMREAFGVQREIKANEMPKGTSIIAQEFSPGRPQPTPIIELRQSTTDESKQNLDFGDLKPEEEDDDDVNEMKKQLEEKIQQMLKAQLAKLQETLDKEVGTGTIELEMKGHDLVIRIREKGSFPSGSAQLNRSFYPILGKIGKVLRQVPGQIIVSGHTDNIPIFTAQYPSNWILSAARSSSVVHHLTKYAKIPGDKVQIRAHGDTVPIDDNSTAEGRANNRRVEISVKFGGLDGVATEELKEAIGVNQQAELLMTEAEELDDNNELTTDAEVNAEGETDIEGEVNADTGSTVADEPADNGDAGSESGVDQSAAVGEQQSELIDRSSVGEQAAEMADGMQTEAAVETESQAQVAPAASVETNAMEEDSPVKQSNEALESQVLPNNGAANPIPANTKTGNGLQQRQVEQIE